MHEFSLMQNLVAKVEQVAKEHGATAIKRIIMKIGTQAGVEAELFARAFELVAPTTICSGAHLEIISVAARWECPACQAALTGEGWPCCSRCEEPGRLIAGNELNLERLEMEVP